MTRRLDPAIAASLNDFGEVPLVVIAQDPDALFQHDDYVATFGAETAEAKNTYWQQGLDFYSGLSTNTGTVTASGTAFERIIWDNPDLILDNVISPIRSSP